MRDCSRGVKVRDTDDVEYMSVGVKKDEKAVMGEGDMRGHLIKEDENTVEGIHMDAVDNIHIIIIIIILERGEGSGRYRGMENGECGDGFSRGSSTGGIG